MEAVLIVTISGPDRAGLVEQLAARVTEHGGNWEHSRMTHLADRFVGLLQITVPSKQRQNLESAIYAIPDLEVTISQAKISAQAPIEIVFELELIGSDHLGIVRDIFSSLAKAGANVESLRTQTSNAAESGGLIFKANARLSCSYSMDLDSLRTNLEAIAQDILVDFVLK